MAHQLSSNHAPTMDHQLNNNNSKELTTLPQPNSQEPTMVPQLNNSPAQTTVPHQQPLMEFPKPKPKTSTTSTANVPTATNKPHPTLMESHQLTATATTVTETTTETADTTATLKLMKNQQNMNSNTMFKMNKLVSTSDIRNNVKDQSPLVSFIISVFKLTLLTVINLQQESTTFSCPMAVNKLLPTLLTKTVTAQPSPTKTLAVDHTTTTPNNKEVMIATLKVSVDIKSIYDPPRCKQIGHDMRSLYSFPTL
jgi:hypothetical protein